MNLKPASAAGTTANKPPVSAPANQNAAAPEATDQFVVTPELKSQAEDVLVQMVEARKQLNVAVQEQIVDQAPAGFKELLNEARPSIEEAAQALTQQTGAGWDPGFLLAQEIKTVSQAALNAEARADIREENKQPADRGALFQEELGYLVQANLLGQVAPGELLVEVSQRKAEGEALVSAGTFVNGVLAELPAALEGNIVQLPAEQQEAARANLKTIGQQLKEQAAADPALAALAKNPEWAAKIGESMQNEEGILSMAGKLGTYFDELNKIATNEATAVQILATAEQQGIK